MATRCFMLELTTREAVELRRYRHEPNEEKCTASGFSYHNASVRIGTTRRVIRKGNDVTKGPYVRHSDRRWPKQCACGYKFLKSDHWQVRTEAIYRRSDTGEQSTLRDAPPGSIYDAWWLHDWVSGINTWRDSKGDETGAPFWIGPDGLILYCQTPGGLWCIDGRASNCTLPTDNDHRCWVRHGVPPNLTVDKNGKTCAAGAGSIQAGSYHGFLQNGELT